MTLIPNPLITRLADELEPVRPMHGHQGFAWVILATALTIAMVALWHGLWNGPLRGEASAIFFVANGLIALLGFASGRAVVRMAMPRVGARHDGPRWVLAALAVLPITALFLIAQQDVGGHQFHAEDGLHCFLSGLMSSVAVAGVLIVWLRRGAPVAPNIAGFYTGVCAGAFGSFAFGLSCSFDTMSHLGIWHVAPVAVSALLGRLCVPTLIRW
ncbi:MAG: DUF1109 domain-containing protein [Porphyrobacter sp.]|nr:DUF1109 domain-containing protein [Porphyrobacter sp.]